MCRLRRERLSQGRGNFIIIVVVPVLKQNYRRR